MLLNFENIKCEINHFFSSFRQTTPLRDPDGGHAVQGHLDAGHGPGDGRVQAQAQGHPGAVQERNQPDVRVLNHHHHQPRPKNHTNTERETEEEH